MNKIELAVIIPAYKQDFFRKTIESLASQTSKTFNVYIGDDASPYELKSIAEAYAGRINLKYTRFEKNLGSVSLVDQWNRCIALSENEPWIWLFSDDDIMDPTCVQAFLETDKKNIDLFHFNVKVIDGEDNVIRTSVFPPVLSTHQFVAKRFSDRINSYAVEYIFRRSSFENLGGVVPFDLAWHSDDATWISLSGASGIKTISGPFVKWRSSGVNITSDQSVEIKKRKIEASLEFFKWLKFRMPIPFVSVFWFVNSIFSSRNVLIAKERRKYLSRFSDLNGGRVTFFIGKIYYHLKSLKRHEGIHISDI